MTRVEYRDFRNMERRVLEPGRGLTILVGPNAVGKTNCVEGIYLLTSGGTFRHTAGMGDLVRQGAARARVSMRAEGEKRVVDVACDIADGKRTLSVNGKPRRAGALAAVLPSVLFYPDDLLVVKGGAAGRRELVDLMGAQLNDTYARLTRDYARAREQRNALLRDGLAGTDVFAAWTESLVRSGAMLALYRRSLLHRLAPYVTQAYEAVAPGERLEVAYESAYAGEAGERGQMEDALRAQLDAVRDEEVRRRVTLAGPHRDDVGLAIDGRSARLFGSQGQQRTLVLAIKLAQVRLVREISGSYPVFLLDDVMSELDARRRSALFELIDTGVQTVVTTTHLDYFTPGERAASTVVEMGPAGGADAAVPAAGTDDDVAREVAR